MFFEFLPPSEHGRAFADTDRSEPCRMVRFSRSMNDVFSVQESSESVSAFSIRPAAPSKAFRSTVTVQSRRSEDATDHLFVEVESVSDDCVETRPSMLETVVRRAFLRRESLFALDTPVATPFPGSRGVETVADDVSGTYFPLERARGIETSAILRFGLALSTKELRLSKSSSNSSTRAG